MKKLKTILKWRFKRWLINVDRKTYKKRKLNDNERLIREVLIKIVSNPSSIILISPLSKTIYIQTENKDYTIVLSNEKIKITNHKLFIETNTDFFFCKDLFEIVYHYVEKYRVEMDKEIFKDEVDGLNFMLKQLKELN
jgi:hypothetical protein